MAHAGEELTFGVAGHFRGFFCDHKGLFGLPPFEGFALPGSPLLFE